MSSRQPNSVETLPSGDTVEYYDNVGVDGKPQRRRYTINGVKCDSISTIASMMPKDLTSWAYSVGLDAGIKAAELGALDVDTAKIVAKDRKFDMRSVTDKASSRGTSAHSEAERMLNEKRDYPWINVSPETISGYAEAAAKFINKHVEAVVHTERIVASRRLNVSGRLDAVCLLKGVRNKPFLSVVDFKTTDRDRNFQIYNSHIAQLSGYAICLSESGYEKVNKASIVRLHKNGEFCLHTFSVKPGIFRACVKLHEADKQARKIASQTASLQGLAR